MTAVAGGGSDGLVLRAMEPADEPAALEVLQASLGWVPDDQYARFYRWKHHENPFGTSPAWVAMDGDRLVALRVLLRWEFERDGEPVRALRAVDTATHPDHQGRGLFRRLTLLALDELAAEGVRFVFNTPNDQSRPGYLKMGWHVVGRPRVSVRPRVRSLSRLVRSRTPADKWSLPTSAGEPAQAVLDDEGGLQELLGSQPRVPAGVLRTARSPAFYRWRYGFDALRYRVVTLGGDVGGGFAVFRLRRRGRSTEAAVVDVLVPGDQPRLRAAALRASARAAGADYAIALGPAAPMRTGYLPFPQQGPVLTWRSVTDPPPAPSLGAWRFGLGDVELF